MLMHDYLRINARIVDEFLDKQLGEAPGIPAKLLEAMRYGVLGGGKKVRASLVFATGEAFALSVENLVPLAAAIEMMHSFSLVHDDLPSMDNDDFRRGKPSLHRAYGEDMGILAGDALLVEGLKLVTTDQHFLNCFGSDKIREITGIVLDSLGSRGMVAGQVLDMEYEGHSVGWEAILQVYRMKTARFIQAPILCAAVAGEASQQEREALSRFGILIGESFQVVDDLLDITQSSDHLGKTAGKDVGQEKATLIRLFGEERARQFLQDTFTQALAIGRTVARPLDRLLALARFIVERDR